MVNGIKAGGLNIGQTKKKKEDEKKEDPFILNPTPEQVAEFNAETKRLKEQRDAEHKFLGESLQRKEDPFGRTYEEQRLASERERAKGFPGGGQPTIDRPVIDQPIIKQTPEVFRDPQSGKITGVTTETGQVLLGFDDQEARDFIERKRKIRETPEGALEVAEASRLRKIEEERQRLITEQTPKRVELDPQRDFIEKAPIIGGIFSFSKTLINKLLPDSKFTGKDVGALTPQQLRTVALTAIEREEIERGLTANEVFGSFVEGIPVLGGLASKYSTTIETPAGNAQEAVNNIRKEKRRLTNIETNVKLGYLPVSVAQGQIDDIEENVQRLESRIKLLINNSPTLKFNSDGVNTIETEILGTREKIFQAKQNILTGKTNDPDEIDLLVKLQEMGFDEEEEL